VTATTTATVPAPHRPAPGPDPGPPAPRGVVHDAWVIARRGLLHIRRQPEVLSDATLQPVMFVLVFGFVLGGAIHAPGGGRYREFLMGGVMAQAVVFGVFSVALALATDRHNQAVDRFRALPVAEGAVLGGHALTHMVKSVLSIALTTLCGLAVGWRIRGGALDAVGGYLLLVGFAFAMIWVGILLGSLVSSPERMNGPAFAVLFPMTFIASTFVPATTLPGVLRAVADWNPTTTLADALRLQFGNPSAPSAAGDPWSIAHPAAYTAVWIVGIVAVCAPLAVRAYRRSLTR